MSRDPIPRSRPFDLYHASACDDAPVSHGHRPNKGLRIIIADDHPIVLTGIEMVLSSFTDFTCSVVAKAENALCPGDRPDNKTDSPRRVRPHERPSARPALRHPLVHAIDAVLRCRLAPMSSARSSGQTRRRYHGHTRLDSPRPTYRQ